MEIVAKGVGSCAVSEARGRLKGAKLQFECTEGILAAFFSDEQEHSSRPPLSPNGVMVLCMYAASYAGRPGICSASYGEGI